MVLKSAEGTSDFERSVVSCRSEQLPEAESSVTVIDNWSIHYNKNYLKRALFYLLQQMRCFIQ